MQDPETPRPWDSALRKCLVWQAWRTSPERLRSLGEEKRGAGVFPLDSEVIGGLPDIWNRLNVQGNAQGDLIHHRELFVVGRAQRRLRSLLGQQLQGVACPDPVLLHLLQSLAGIG